MKILKSKKYISIDIFLIQSKRSPSFAESAVEKVIATAKDIFDLNKDISELKDFYNSDLVDKVNTFRKIYLRLAARHPILHINYTYASKGNKSTINKKVFNKAKILKETINQYFLGTTGSVDFFGARELIDASRIEKSYTLQLKFLENYISRGEDNYVLLSSLKDYYDFVIDENSELRRYIFAFNVRDYQGHTIAVNKDIKNSLESQDKKLDFWLLNNGITILASKASIAGKTINLDDAQIVNGLQTTHTIYNFIKSKGIEYLQLDNRAILIKIVVTNDAKTRDSVIKATNFQTPISDASLKATEPIQSDIENYFLIKGWFYDRRKNYHKNNGKPIDKIISIPYLAQAVMAIVLREPDVSRARPSSILKNKSDYERVFKQNFNLDMYRFCAETLKYIESFIRITEQLDQEILNKWLHPSPLRILSFHLGMLFIVKLLGKTDYKAKDVETLLDTKLDEKQEVLNLTLFELIDLTDSYAKQKPLQSISTIIKQREFVIYLLSKINCSPTNK